MVNTPEPTRYDRLAGWGHVQVHPLRWALVPLVRREWYKNPAPVMGFTWLCFTVGG